jgi:hypothetical protein
MKKSTAMEEHMTQFDHLPFAEWMVELERFLLSKPRNVERACLLALIHNDAEEVNRLISIIERRNSLQLNVVDGSCTPRA